MTKQILDHPYTVQRGKLKIQGTGDLNLDIRILDHLEKGDKPPFTLKDHLISYQTMTCQRCLKTVLELYNQPIFPGCNVTETRDV